MRYGKHTLGECQRSGAEVPLGKLVRDGQNPELLVLPEYRDPYHPQLKIRRVEDLAGVRNPAPELVKNTPPVLSLDDLGTTADLDWTRAVFPGSLVLSYALYRSVNGADAVLVATLPVTRDFLAGVLSETLAYSDAGLSPGTTYAYYVESTDTGLQYTVRSNVVTLTAANTGLVYQFLNVPLS